jgi:hypothetical protein
MKIPFLRHPARFLKEEALYRDTEYCLKFLRNLTPRSRRRNQEKLWAHAYWQVPSDEVVNADKLGACWRSTRPRSRSRPSPSRLSASSKGCAGRSRDPRASMPAAMSGGPSASPAGRNPEGAAALRAQTGGLNLEAGVAPQPAAEPTPGRTRRATDGDHRAHGAGCAGCSPGCPTCARLPPRACAIESRKS